MADIQINDIPDLVAEAIDQHSPKGISLQVAVRVTYDPTYTGARCLYCGNRLQDLNGEDISLSLHIGEVVLMVLKNSDILIRN